MRVFTVDPERVEIEEEMKQLEDALNDETERTTRGDLYNEFLIALDNWKQLTFKPLTLVYTRVKNDFGGPAVVIKDHGESLEVFLLITKKIISVHRESIGFIFEFTEKDKKDEKEFVDYLSNRARARVEAVLEDIDHPLAGQIALRSVL